MFVHLQECRKIGKNMHKISFELLGPRNENSGDPSELAQHSLDRMLFKFVGNIFKHDRQLLVAFFDRRTFIEGVKLWIIKIL